MSHQQHQARGVLASVASSLFFGALYFLTPLLAPLSAESIWAIRVIITVPCVLLVLFALRQWPLAREMVIRCKKRPLLILGVLASGTILAAQLWLFAWAPLNGRGLEVALGYFLLPLTLVLVGRVLYKDTLAWWQWLATGIAALGVLAEIIRVGGISWETLVVAIGYPLYFVLRRSMGTNHLAGQFWEMAVALPVALVLVGLEVGSGTALTENPTLWWFAPLLAFVSAFALICYILASKLLPMSSFGLLSYLEPALLMIAALLIGETIGGEELWTYAAIWLAVLIIIVGGVLDILRLKKLR